MSRVSAHRATVIGLLSIQAAGMTVFGSCSSSPARSSDGDSGSAGSDSAVDGSVRACTLQLVFSPMYSAYESAHVYQVPAVLVDPQQGQIYDGVIWSASPASAASVDVNPSLGQATITVYAAPPGGITIAADYNGMHCTAPLAVTQATPEQWQAGYDLFNKNNVPLGNTDLACAFRRAGLDASAPEGGCPDANPGCVSCHAGSYNPITPEQLAEFNDQDLIGILTQTIIPGCGDGGNCYDGGYFGGLCAAPGGAFGLTEYELWRRFHAVLNVPADQAEAMIVYLRSLRLAVPSGCGVFGGPRPRPDAGVPSTDGGLTMDDASPPNGDGGSPIEAGDAGADAD